MGPPRRAFLAGRRLCLLAAGALLALLLPCFPYPAAFATMATTEAIAILHKAVGLPSGEQRPDQDLVLSSLLTLQREKTELNKVDA
ncbi:hypothetical protein AK812_SmicGene21507 [Symbiodinium microadriaticum]|uniref:Uncharacterized protein n=1 Tax=Symbiodinium microadriaticum TaxID=2951 RepID=A0A1Q9DM78_SYMMI|nr:hypothetical protein AK812_SmicGene21507 [Symbiodinium microadriaticum]